MAGDYKFIEDLIEELKKEVKSSKEEHESLGKQEQKLLSVLNNDNRPFWKKLFFNLPEKKELKQCKKEQKKVEKIIQELEKLISSNYDLLMYVDSNQ